MFPCDAERIGHIDESIGIVKSPSESFYAILCGNSIRILDARDRCFPEIAFLETGSETKNHWILWPSETRIVFGTCTGKVCVLRFEKETLEVLLEKPFPSVITSVFASHDKQICLILTGPKFVCMDLNGVIQTNVALPKAFGIIKNAWEVSKGVFGFESNRGWILYDLNKKTSQKIGVESFDDDFRNRVLNKNATFSSIEELKKYFDSPCLMVGIQGQTKEMIQKDMDILTHHFDYGTISIYRNNSTPIKRDESLIQWFMQNYAYLQDDPRYDFLCDPTDFGVGD